MVWNNRLPLLRLLKSSMYLNPFNLIKSHTFMGKVKDKDHLKWNCLVRPDLSEHDLNLTCFIRDRSMAVPAAAAGQ